MGGKRGEEAADRASAGRLRRTSGADGADIGRGPARVKEYYRKKGIILETGPAHGFSQGKPKGRGIFAPTSAFAEKFGEWAVDARLTWR